MNNIEINFEIITQSAFFVGSGLGIAGTVDRACLKDAQGFPYFPGSSIKGKVRYFCKQLLQLPHLKTAVTICQTLSNLEICKFDQPCLICKLFGSMYTEGALQFYDAKLKEEFQAVIKKRNPLDIKFPTTLRSNNKIHRYSKTTENGHLFTTEVGEKDLVFDGKIVGEVNGMVLEKIPLELALLLAGIRLIDGFGGQMSRGLGKCKINIGTITIDEKDYLLTELQEELNLEWNSLLEGEKL